MRLFTLAVCACVALAVSSAQAQQQVRVTVENLQPSDGFYLTPVWTGFHDGTFDFFDAGTMSSSSLEGLAEEGDVSGILSDFAGAGVGQDGVLTNPAGFGGAPVIDPGESASAIFDLNSSERYLSFATMLIPSNDGFFGNDSGIAIEVLDGSGAFSFAGPIDFTLDQLWDAGTELNNGLGAAFSGNGGTDTTEANNIALHAGLNNFDGTTTADGSTINFANASASPVFRLTVTAVPEPSSLAVLGLLSTVGLIRRKR